MEEEAGIGRLLTADQRTRGLDGPLRSAFAIGDGYVLTAWHCLRRMRSPAKVWLRLQAPATSGGFVDIPLRYSAHARHLDAALLAFDGDTARAAFGAAMAGDLRRHLDMVALPLGVRVAAHDKVRIGGFPERNPARGVVLLAGSVHSASARVGHTRAIRVHVPEVAAARGESPRGMSGGPLLRQAIDGSERVVGVLVSFPVSARDGRQSDGTALGGQVICRHLADLRAAFPAVAALLDRTPPEPDIPAPTIEDCAVALSPDVIDRYRPVFDLAGIAVPDVWHLDALTRLRPATGGHGSREADTVAALRGALRAKPVFTQIGGGSVELGRLEVIYQREIGDWPIGATPDALLVEASDVDTHELHNGFAGPLRALARYMVGVAAAVRVAPADHPGLASWIASAGHLLGDAQRHYRLRLDTGAWLLVDLGDEPAPGLPPYPMRIAWTLYCVGGDGQQDEVSGAVLCDGSRAGLHRALGEVFRVLPPHRSLVVDLAMPYPLLGAGIEHWPVREMDGDHVAISADGRPRLRWSRRSRDQLLRERLVTRINGQVWTEAPARPAERVLADPDRLKEWIDADAGRSCLVAGVRAPVATDPLRALLRAGCGFVIWYPTGLAQAHHKKIRTVAGTVPPEARRTVLPDELPAFRDRTPYVIWDDPHGRGPFTLPPFVPAENF